MGLLQEVRSQALTVMAALCQREPVGTPHESNMSQVLLAALQDERTLVQAQALDKIMDVFSVDERDGTYRALNCHQFISTAVTQLKAKVHRKLLSMCVWPVFKLPMHLHTHLQLRNQQEQAVLGREALSHVKEVHLNGVRFLKYKSRRS